MTFDKVESLEKIKKFKDSLVPAQGGVTSKEQRIQIEAPVELAKPPLLAVYVILGNNEAPSYMKRLMEEAQKAGNKVVLLTDNSVAALSPSPTFEQVHVIEEGLTAGFEETEAIWGPFAKAHNPDHLYSIELRNEVRYVILANFMKSRNLEEITHFDIDAAPLAPLAEIFDAQIYKGCDAVISFGQRFAYRHPPPSDPNNFELDAYWAGTARLSRALVEAYVLFVREMFNNTYLLHALRQKSVQMPTVNDMTSWYLFTLASGSAPLDACLKDFPQHLKNKFKICDSSPSGVGDVRNYVLNGPSQELPHHAVFRSASGAYYVTGEDLINHAEGIWGPSYKSKIAPVLSGRILRVMTIHSKDPSVFFNAPVKPAFVPPVP